MIRSWRKWRLRVDLAQENNRFWVVTAVVCLGVAALYSVSQGAVAIPFSEVFSSASSESHPMHRVVWDVRIPRLLCGAAVGADLAVAGALLQTMVRNPLADPGILGVTAGAGLAALVAIIFFPGSSSWVPWAAFVGGLSTIGVILGLAWTGARTAGPLRIVLSGVALQAVLFAGIALLSFAFADRAPSFTAFMVGSLNGLGWGDVHRLIVPTVLGIALAFIGVRQLNLLLLDDETAGGLGLAVKRARFGASCVSALLAAGAVSAAGLVGFVGLVVPNGVRLLVGPDHRLLLPVVAISGAALVLVADTVTRTIVAPIELPVGALMALIGGPYFLFILWRKIA